MYKEDQVEAPASSFASESRVNFAGHPRIHQIGEHRFRSEFDRLKVWSLPNRKRHNNSAIPVARQLSSLLIPTLCFTCDYHHGI
jgi:hypothetical protein